MNLVLFGPPGSGKGTQSGFLVRRKGYVQISTGDILRAAVEAGTTLGHKAKSFMDQGQLVPDEVVVGLVDEFIAGLGGKKFVLDGFPRSVLQSKALDEILSIRGLTIEKAFFLSVDLDLIANRVADRRVCPKCNSVFNMQSLPPKVSGRCDNCGEALIQRKDDMPEVVKSRLEAYRQSTAKLAEYYESKGISQVVDGHGSAEEVFRQIEKMIN